MPRALLIAPPALLIRLSKPRRLLVRTRARERGDDLDEELDGDAHAGVRLEELLEVVLLIRVEQLDAMVLVLERAEDGDEGTRRDLCRAIRIGVRFWVGGKERVELLFDVGDRLAVSVVCLENPGWRGQFVMISRWIFDIP